MNRDPEPLEAPLVLTPREAAKLLRVRAENVRELCRRGELPHRKVGSRFLIGRRALEDWLAGKT